MNLIQILLVVLVVFLVTSILFLFALPTTKKRIDSSVAKSIQIHAPQEKRHYFGIHRFTSGWEEAKKSPQKFLLFVVLSPLIFISWLLWSMFGREMPKDFERIFPLRHAGGRPKGGAYEADNESVHMILEDEKDFDEVFKKMRPQYFTDEQWDKLHDEYQKKRAFDVWKRRIKRRLETNQ